MWSSSSSSSGIEHHITPLLCDFLPFQSSCSQPSHTTDHKNGTHCLAWHSAFRDHPMIPEGSIAASHQSLTGGVMCGGQPLHPLGCDSGTLTKPDQPPVPVGACESICLQKLQKTNVNIMKQATKCSGWLKLFCYRNLLSCHVFLSPPSLKDLHLTQKYLNGFALFQLALEEHNETKSLRW